MKNRNFLNSAIYMALYIALCFINPYSFGLVQVRVAEALCILPIFDKYSIISIFLGCFISNLLNGNIVDAIFGGLATLVALYLTYKIKSKNFFVRTAPTIILNAIVVPLILKYAYGINVPLFISIISIAVGEAISVYVLGFVLYKLILKLNLNFNKD